MCSISSTVRLKKDNLLMICMIILKAVVNSGAVLDGIIMRGASNVSPPTVYCGSHVNTDVFISEIVM